MCRLAALPPGTTYLEAMRIAQSLEGHNTDGVGTAHVIKGQFVIKKFPVALSVAVEKKMDLFSHLPHDGWTILHTRLATHGGNTDANTHPFEIGDYAFAHNGTWSDSEICRFALEGHRKFNGETDSEVAGYFFNRYGPEEFAKRITRGGVFLGLHRSGEVHVVKTYGDLQVANVDGVECISKPTGACILASELTTKDIDSDAIRDVESGVIRMNPDGTVKEWGPETRKPWKNSHSNYLPFANNEWNRRGSSGSGGSVTTETKTIKQPKVETNSSINFWQLDPSNYLCDMLGDD